MNGFCPLCGKEVILREFDQRDEDVYFAVDCSACNKNTTVLVDEEDIGDWKGAEPITDIKIIPMRRLLDKVFERDHERI